MTYVELSEVLMAPISIWMAAKPRLARECVARAAKPNTTRRRWKWLVQGNQNLLYGPITRSNCKLQEYQAQYLLRHEHEHVVRHCCCCCCCCYATLWGSEVGGKRSSGGAMASSFWKICGFTIHTRTGGLRFWISPPWDPCVVRCQALRFQDLCGRSAKTMQYMCVFTKERCRLDGALQ